MQAAVRSGDDRGRPAKKSRLDWTDCLCHCRDEEVGELTPFTDVSWQSLQRAAEVRRDKVFRFLEGRFADGPRGGYHRRCYQSYTNKTLLKRLPSQTQTRESDDEGEDFESEPSETHVRRTRGRVSSASGGAVNLGNVGRVSLRRGRTDSVSTDLKACIVCQDEKKIDKYTVEPLTQCLTYQASHTFLEAARVHRHTKKGKRILLAIENEDLIAIEVRYHRSCYYSFTHKRNLERVASSAPCSSLVEDEESSDETLPFATVFAEVEDQLFQKKNVLQLSSIRERLRS